MNKYVLQLLPLVIGAGSFFLVAGFGPIASQNIGWLTTLNPDQIMHYLGWAFYRFSPWESPLGTMSNYGLDIGTPNAVGTTTVYTDSIPLVAILFKALNPILPTPFQYLGLWLLLCLSLQSYFGWKLGLLITKNNISALLIACLFTFSPILIWRFMHASHVAHFLILAALLLIFNRDKKFNHYWWACLLCLSTLINFYIFVMLFALWLSDSLDCLLVQKNISFQKTMLTILVFCIVIPVCMWQAGYFVNIKQGSVASGHFGMYQMNLLAPITSHGWSYILPNIPNVPIPYGSWVNNSIENFMYFGAGVLLLFVAAAASYPIKTSITPNIRNHFFLITCSCVLFIFSLSHNIQVGPFEFHLPIPEKLASLFSIFRSSARMFWPVYYLLIFGLINILAKAVSEKKFQALITLAVVIQVIDTSAGWIPLRNTLNSSNSSQFQSYLKAPFWNQAAKYYSSVLGVPVSNLSTLWPVIPQYAEKNGLSTNVAYVSRDSQSQTNIINQEIDAMLFNQRFPSKSFFVFDKESLLIPFILSAIKGVDLLAQIDNLYVFAPNWFNCKSCAALGIQSISSDELMPIFPLQFTKSKQGTRFLIPGGWQYPEAWGVWSKGATATLVLPLPSNSRKPTRVILELNPFVTPAHPKQEVAITINGSFVKKLDLYGKSKVELDIPGAYTQFHYASIEFQFRNATSPKALGVDPNDDRTLAIGLISADMQ